MKVLAGYILPTQRCMNDIFPNQMWGGKPFVAVPQKWAAQMMNNNYMNNGSMQEETHLEPYNGYNSAPTYTQGPPMNYNTHQGDYPTPMYNTHQGDYPIPMEEMPQTYDRLHEYLYTQIGKYARLEFYLGNNTYVDREGIIYKVGENYILLKEKGQDVFLACDIYSIKFVSVYKTPPEIVGMDEMN